MIKHDTGSETIDRQKWKMFSKKESADDEGVRRTASALPLYKSSSVTYSPQETKRQLSRTFQRKSNTIVLSVKLPCTI